MREPEERLPVLFAKLEEGFLDRWSLWNQPRDFFREAKFQEALQGLRATQART